MSANPQHHALTERFQAYLKASEALRPGYIASLGAGVSGGKIAEVVPAAPELLSVIYSQVSGTDGGEEEVSLIEFIPGYRLIHIDEYREQLQALNRILEEKKYQGGGLVLPLLANYGGDFICYRRTEEGREQICDLMQDYGELVVMYDSPDSFLDTLCEFYRQEVYFLDEDGFLDCDLIREGEVGAALNPDSQYWTE
ncbi:SMI1/KNR4 family protein ['Paenibacillus yunnanensis' Narsing Rao et al. 2020]|uniref:SMI1/KNR4 family protein n=1 Tax=Paenibacillus tengchongensis TaxID=2608684 RepID=UPI00124D0B6A|nr:SMI1/KNR4 family protein [Paenibacillus tengchongensis]